MPRGLSHRELGSRSESAALLELLRGGTTTPVPVTRDSVVAAAAGYRNVVYRTRVQQSWYFDSTRTTRR